MKTILLVEDDPASAAVVSEKIKLFGYNVIAVNTGEKAVDLAMTDEKIDLILMDIVLGDGIDGTEAAKQILAKRALPIVFISSHSEKKIVDKVRGISRYGYVLKNSNQNVLQSSIEMAFELFDAHTKMRGSEEKFRLLVENSHDIIYSLTADGIFLFVSPAWTTLLGHPLNRVVGQPFQQFVHPDDIPGCMIFLKSVIETGKRQDGADYRVRHDNGTWYWHTSSAVPLKDDAGSIVGFYGIARDVTARKKEQDDLKELVSSLQKALEEIKTLRGIVPICANCKKIRDDKGYWENVEAYIGRHTEAQFSHGVCPDCMKELYPKFGMGDKTTERS